jgi:hypothetical protein
MYCCGEAVPTDLLKLGVVVASASCFRWASSAEESFLSINLRRISVERIHIGKTRQQEYKTHPANPLRNESINNIDQQDGQPKPQNSTKQSQANKTLRGHPCQLFVVRMFARLAT